MGDGRAARRRSDAGPDRRLRCGPARQGRDGRRGRRRWPTRCWRPATRSRSTVACSTSSAPGATGRCRSTSRRWRRSSRPARAPAWSSTAAGRPRRSPARPTCSSARHPPGPPPARVAEVAAEAGITFCFAAAFHPAMRHAAVPRRELGIATRFNLLGPLTNPARPQAQAIGCADPRMAPVMAGVFAARGVDAWVFRGDDGLDELTTTTTSTLWRVHGGEVTELTVDPASLGIAPRHDRGPPRRRRRPQRRRRTPSPGRRAGSGARRGAAQRRCSARGLRRTRRRRRTTPSPPGWSKASEAIDSGAAAAMLDRWVAALLALSVGAPGGVSRTKSSSASITVQPRSMLDGVSERCVRVDQGHVDVEVGHRRCPNRARGGRCRRCARARRR